MKNLKRLGQALNKEEQKAITGGKLPLPQCQSDTDCGFGMEYTDPITGYTTCYSVSCGTDKQCHMTIC